MSKEAIIKKIFSMPIEDVEDIKAYVDQIVHLDQERHHDKLIKKNKKYVGKCYKHIGKNDWFPHYVEYFQVISERACNVYSVSILKFPENPLCYFKDYTSGLRMDKNCGIFEFIGIDVDHIATEKIKECQEISIDDFLTAMDEHIELLKHLDWNINHK